MISNLKKTYFQNRTEITYQMLKVRHFTMSWTVLTHFGAMKGWKSYCCYGATIKKRWIIFWSGQYHDWINQNLLILLTKKEGNRQCTVQKPVSLMVWSCISASDMRGLHIWKGTINAAKYMGHGTYGWDICSHPDYVSFREGFT